MGRSLVWKFGKQKILVTKPYYNLAETHKHCTTIFTSVLKESRIISFWLKMIRNFKNVHVCKDTKKIMNVNHWENSKKRKPCLYLMMFWFSLFLLLLLISFYFRRSLLFFSFIPKSSFRFLATWRTYCNAI